MPFEDPIFLSRKYLTYETMALCSKKIRGWIRITTKIQPDMHLKRISKATTNT